MIDRSDALVTGLPDNRLVSLRGNDRCLKLLGCSACKRDLLLIECDTRCRLNNRHLARGAILAVLSGNGDRGSTGLDRGHDAVRNRGDLWVARRPGHILIRCIVGLNRCGQRRGLTAHSKLKIRRAEADARDLCDRSGYRNCIRGCRDPINRCRDRGITVTDSGNKTVAIDGKDALVRRGPDNLTGLIVRGNLCLQLLSRALVHRC